MSKSAVSSMLALGMVGLLTVSQVEAAPPSVAGTSWDLSGKLKGRLSVKCKRTPGISTPIASGTVLDGAIQFDDGEVEGDGEGTFIMTDAYFTVQTASGTWSQKGAKLNLAFDHWYDSPMAVFAFAFAQVSDEIQFDDNGVVGSAGGFKITQPLTVKGTINKKGTRLTLNEGLGFKFTASAAAMGGSNTCTYKMNGLGRKYTGGPQE
ncbi:hypothetical protein [Methylomonas sp. HYX-M1]|uniref:hypothetical protein n=1 Tax=Methylomonas sp. HYX-M1 TaxID=3139307 RepID=UPI00345BEBA6